MTSKERYKKAFSNTGTPDRVPFEPGLDFDTTVDLSGLNSWEYEDQGSTSLGENMLWSKKLGFDLYHYAAGIPEPVPGDGIDVSEKKWEQDDLRITETNVTTPSGTIRQRRRFPKHGPSFTYEKFIKNLPEDWAVFREYFGEDWVVNPRYFEEYKRVGDLGVTGVVVHSPIDWWGEYRHGGIEQTIYDLYDHPKLMEEIFAHYRKQSFAYLEKAAKLDPRPDFIIIHGSSCSGSVISPSFFRRSVLPYLQEASALLKKHEIPSMFHCCGKSREWVEYVADSDINVMDALECPPTGNVDLAEVKRLYGDRLCLKGNVSVLVMVNGTRGEVRDEVKRCIDSAAAGGGFVLSIGDSIGPKANLANIEEMVQTALEYGKY
ncbi:MAG TPA: hypothetical protein ENH84_00680 [Phycisphaerae bacterium]|nr:hypothetical protein [Phycisphaerae bacterium]